MLINGINLFLLNSMGPSKFCQDLHERIKLLSDFFKYTAGVINLKSEIPDSITGGDINALMSESLRNLLQNTVSDENIDLLPIRRPLKFPDFIELKHSNTASIRESNTVSEVKPSSTQLFQTGQIEKGQQSFPELPYDGTPAKLTKHIFIEKLKKYMELHNQATYPTKPTEKLANSEEIANQQPKFPSMLPHPKSKHSWPDMIGQNAEKKAQSLLSGRNLQISPKRINQSIQTEFPEKIEIQNIFNIELKGQDTLGDSGTNLSDKIAEILRDQAIQHGIDIT